MTISSQFAEVLALMNSIGYVFDDTAPHSSDYIGTVVEECERRGRVSTHLVPNHIDHTICYVGATDN